MLCEHRMEMRLQFLPDVQISKVCAVLETLRRKYNSLIKTEGKYANSGFDNLSAMADISKLRESDGWRVEILTTGWISKGWFPALESFIDEVENVCEPIMMISTEEIDKSEYHEILIGTSEEKHQHLGNESMPRPR